MWARDRQTAEMMDILTDREEAPRKGLHGYLDLSLPYPRPPNTHSHEPRELTLEKREVSQSSGELVPCRWMLGQHSSEGLAFHPRLTSQSPDHFFVPDGLLRTLYNEQP